MPAVSKKQQKFFGYLLSNPEERKKRGVSKKDAEDFAKEVKEVAPPGWGHTKAEKEKTKPWKPKSKIGGTAAAFKRALDDGRFKGLPGSKTKKEKTADMFKLMWSMKKKGDSPHYKPGTDKKYKKYQDKVEEGTSIIQGRTSKKKVSYRGATADHKRDKEGNIEASYYGKREDTRTDVQKKKHSDAVRKFDNYQKLKAQITAKDKERKKHNQEYAARQRANEEEEKRMSPMQDNNFFGNAYAYEKLKKKINSKKKHNKPATTEEVKARYSGSSVTYSQFYKRAKESMAAAQRQKEKARKNKEESDAVRADTRKHGIKFSDAKGSGRIVKGKKVYD